MEAEGSIKQTKITRRNFLKIAGLAGAGLLLGTPVSACRNPDDLTSNKLVSPIPETGQILPDSIPENMRDEILTDEELKEAHIKIYQTSDVQLFLRKNALSMPIFKDAATGKIVGVTISLIDSETITWNAVNKLPEDTRSLWQKFETHPRQWKENTWQDLRQRYIPQKTRYFEEGIKIHEKELAEITSGEREKLYRSLINYAKSDISANSQNDALKLKETIENLKRYEKELETLVSGRETQRVTTRISTEKRLLERARKELDILKGPRDKAVEYYAENGLESVQGLLIQPSSTLNGGRVYIYICVKGQSKPQPQQSFPRPEQFQVFYNKDGTYDVFSDDEIDSAGFILHHEQGHYEDKRQDEDQKKREREADRIAYEHLMKAWRKYRETGDTTGYPFIFVTKEGVTITQKQTAQQTVSS